jgi:SulP family sulfate permease
MEKRLLTSARNWLRSYGWKGFRLDLGAGLTVAAVALPQGMAYALIAGIDPIYGLYTAIVVTALGSLFGSSSHLINGPTNAISLVVFSAVAGLGELTPQEKLHAVFSLALFSGLIQILIAFLKFGDLTRYVSESVLLGFMLGAALLIALSQIPNLLGLETQGARHHHLLVRLWATFTEDGPIQVPSLCIGLGTLALAVALRPLRARTGFPVPDTLVSLVIATFAAWLVGWHQAPAQAKAGLPGFLFPRLQINWLPHLAWSSLSIAVLGLLEALAIAKSIAVRTKQPLDYNRQCLAEGLANLGGGFFQCLPGSGSLTRSAINYQAGAVSRVSGIITAGAVALCLLILAPLAGYVPRSALAGILVITAWRLVDRPRLRYCLRATRFDAALALSTAAAAVFINIEFSILIGVFLSFFFFVPRAAHLRADELVVSRERVVRERRASDPPCGKLVVLDLEGDLFFGVTRELDRQLTRLARRTEEGVQVIVLRLKRTRNPDMACLERLEFFLEHMQARQVPVLLCGVRPDLAHHLEKLDIFRLLPKEHVFREQQASGSVSSTLQAVRKAYAILGENLCDNCPRRGEEKTGDKETWYYMI